MARTGRSFPAHVIIKSKRPQSAFVMSATDAVTLSESFADVKNPAGIFIDATTAVTASLGVTSKTFAHTCTGSNRILWVAAGSSSTDVTGVTYNGVAMTKVNSVNLQTTWASLWYLVAPATGTNNVVITCGSSQNITGGAMSFTGASQTGVPDSHHEDGSQTGSVTTYSISTTTVANNSFLVFSGRANGGIALTGGTNTTTGQPEVAALGDWMMRSTAGVTPAGTGTLNVTSAAQQFFGVIASFAPAGTTYTQSVTDTYTLAEVFIRTAGKVLTETFTVSSIFIKSLARTLTDSITQSESISTLKTRVLSLTDSTTLSEVFTKAISKPLSDVFTLVETIKKTISKAFAETLSLVESFAAVKGGGLTKTLTDSLSLSDFISKKTTRALIDAIIISETIKKLLNGLLAFWSTKFSRRNSSYSNKNSPRGTNYSDKYHHMQ